MIVDTDTVEAGLLAADDERGEVRQRSPNRDSEIDADPGHLTKAPLFSIPTIRSLVRPENRAKRFLPATHRCALATGLIVGDVRYRLKKHRAEPPTSRRCCRSPCCNCFQP